MKRIITLLAVWNILVTGFVLMLAYDSHVKFEAIGAYIQHHEQESRAAIHSIVQKLTADQ